MAEGYDDPREGQQIIREVHHHHDGNGDSKSFARLKDSLLLAAILGLGTVIWNMNVTVAELKTTVGYLTEVVKLLQQEKR